MGVKPGYKQTEVGVIPEEWEVKRLRDLCTQICDGTHYTPNYVGQGIPFYSVENVTANEFKNVKHISQQEHEQLINRCRPEKGDILLTRIGTLGQTKLIDWDINASIYVSLALLKLYDKNTARYLYNYSKSKQFIGDVENRSLMNAIPKKINMGDIGDIAIPMPPFAEQQAISTALSDVDGLIDSLTKLIDKKKNIKQGAMRELLTCTKRLQGFGGAWLKRPLGVLFDFSGGYPASWADLSTQGYCYLHYGDIHGSKKQFTDVENEYMDIPKLDVQFSKVTADKMLRDGDVVFVDASEDDEGISKHIVVVNPDNIPYISGVHTIVAKDRNSLLNKRFKQYCFQSPNIKEQFGFYAVGTKVKGVNRSSITKIMLHFPSSKKEQIAIANILSDMDAEIEALERKRAKYEALKQGMMQELLTGRIRLI